MPIRVGDRTLPCVAVNLLFTVWLLYGFVWQLPIELEEDAAVDGGGPVQVFYKVVLPLI